MTDSNSTVAHIEETGVIAVLRGVDPSTVVPVVDALRAGGVTAVEVTADSDGVLESIDRLTDAFDDVVVGVGTILDAETASDAIDAGASFVVAPTVDESVIATCNEEETPVVPGAYSPTEAWRAHEAGADLVKLFPASTAGPGHLSSLLGPLSDLRLVPTGGVTPENAQAFIEAGAVAVGAGSSLVPADAERAVESGAITENAERLLAAVEAGRRD